MPRLKYGRRIVRKDGRWQELFLSYPILIHLSREHGYDIYDGIVFEFECKLVYKSQHQCSQTKNMADTSLFQWPMDFNEYYSLQQEQHKKKSKEGWIETKCSSDVDKEWRNYFGDGINPQEFLQRRSRKRSHAKISSMGSDSIAQRKDHVDQSW